MNGLSDRSQAILGIVSDAALAVGGYLAVSSSDPQLFLVGGAVAAAARAIKESLGGQAPPAK